MKTKSFLAGIVLSVLTCTSMSVALAQTPATFTDVPSTHPNYEAIMGLKEKGIIGGYPDGTFKPEQVVNRVEALKIILLGSDIAVPNATGTGGFTDTEANGWYAKYILKAELLAIVQGYPDGTFKPEQTVNLVENLKMLLLANNIDLSSLQVPTDPYADTPKTEWYAKYVQYAKDHNFIDADPQDKVYPAQGMTRAKLAETMYRLIYMNEHDLDWYPPPHLRDGGGPEEPAVVMDISIEDFAFKKSSLTVGKGWTVRWTNKDSVVHTVTSDDGDFDSGSMSEGETFQYTFNEEGTYNYHCTPHPNMKGTIIVKPANQVPTVEIPTA